MCSRSETNLIEVTTCCLAAPGHYFTNQMLVKCQERPQDHICTHYSDVIMGGIASQITSITIVYSTVYSGADQRKYQSSASLAFVQGIHRGLLNSPHKWPVTRKIFPFDDVIMWIILGIALENRRPGYIVTSSPIRWAHTQNYPVTWNVNRNVLNSSDSNLYFYNDNWFNDPLSKI